MFAVLYPSLIGYEYTVRCSSSIQEISPNFLKCWFPVKPATRDYSHPRLLAKKFCLVVVYYTRCNMYFLILYIICLCFCKLYFSYTRSTFLKSCKLYFVVFAPLRSCRNSSGSWEATPPLKSLSPFYQAGPLVDLVTQHAHWTSTNPTSLPPRQPERV